MARLVITTEILRSSLSSALALEVRPGQRQGRSCSCVRIAGFAGLHGIAKESAGDPKAAEDFQIFTGLSP